MRIVAVDSGDVLGDTVWRPCYGPSGAACA
jgi:hypothetical protein